MDISIDEVHLINRQRDLDTRLQNLFFAGRLPLTRRPPQTRPRNGSGVSIRREEERGLEIPVLVVKEREGPGKEVGGAEVAVPDGQDSNDLYDPTVSVKYEHKMYPDIQCSFYPDIQQGIQCSL